MNQNKAPLALMGQLLVVLFFALTAAICLQAFAKSEMISKTSEDRDHAVRISQNVAEVLIHTHGDLQEAASTLNGRANGEELVLTFDKDWNLSEESVYTVTALKEKPKEDEPGLGKALIKVIDKTDAELFALTCAWQEVIE